MCHTCLGGFPVPPLLFSTTRQLTLRSYRPSTCSLWLRIPFLPSSLPGFDLSSTLSFTCCALVFLSLSYYSLASCLRSAFFSSSQVLSALPYSTRISFFFRAALHSPSLSLTLPVPHRFSLSLSGSHLWSSSYSYGLALLRGWVWVVIRLLGGPLYPLYYSRLPHQPILSCYLLPLAFALLYTHPLTWVPSLVLCHLVIAPSILPYSSP